MNAIDRFRNILIGLTIIALISSCNHLIASNNEQKIKSTFEINRTNENDISYPTTIPSPMVTLIPTRISYKRQDLGVSVSGVIEYFKNQGVDFESVNIESDTTRYVGSYGDAYLISLDSINGNLIKGSITIFMWLTENNDNAPGLGDLPMAIFGQGFTDSFIMPWLLGNPENEDNFCLDGIVFDYSDLSKTPANDWIISLSIYLESECHAINGCCT